MTKEMIISSNVHETIVAILEDDLAAEIFVERENQRGDSQCSGRRQRAPFERPLTHQGSPRFNASRLADHDASLKRRNGRRMWA